MTVTKILAVYEAIQHKRKMQEIIGDKHLQTVYGCECVAMWQALQIMYGHDTVSETMDAVHALVNKNNKAVA